MKTVRKKTKHRRKRATRVKVRTRRRHRMRRRHTHRMQVGGGFHEGDYNSCPICFEPIEGLTELDGVINRVPGEDPAAVYLQDGNKSREVSIEKNTFDLKKPYTAYHRKCIDEWMITKSTDPVTRATIVQEEVSESYGPYKRFISSNLSDISEKGTAYMDSIINGVLGKIYTTAKESLINDMVNPNETRLTKMYIEHAVRFVFPEPNGIAKYADEYAVEWANHHPLLPWKKIHNNLERKDSRITVDEKASKYVTLVLEFITTEILGGGIYKMADDDYEEYRVEPRYIQRVLELDRELEWMEEYTR